MSINGSGTPLAAGSATGAGTRALIGVLLLHRTLPAEAVIAGINAALAPGRCDPDLVAVEARRASHPEPCRRVIMLAQSVGALTGRLPRWPATTSCWQEPGR